MLKRYYQLLLLLCLASQVLGQNGKVHHCGFEHSHAQFVKANPKQSVIFQRDAEAMAKSNSNGSLLKSSETYIIPVVFHVFGSTFNNGTTVNLSIILDALAKTNSDFKGLNSDYSLVDAPFANIKKPLDIEFRLAQIDPDGNLTTGVNFYPTKSGFGNGSGFDEQIQQFAWDNYKYMNVYVMHDLYADADYYNSGVAWLPNTWMSDNNLARVVYNGSYIGTNTNENFRRVLTHEFGHFLGLHHTFNDGCTYPNDYVQDTPPADRSNMGNTDLNCEGNVTNWQNFMNYTTQYLNYTQGQVDRMVGFLMHDSRKTLWTEQNLVATGVLGSTAESAVITTGKVFEERYENDGILAGTAQFNLTGNAEFVVSTGTLVDGTHFSIKNLPKGCNAKLEVVSAVKAVLALEGKALYHEKENSTTNIELEFLNAAFTSGKEPVGGRVIKGISAYYNDAYSVYCPVQTRWRNYAYISKVAFKEVSNPTPVSAESQLAIYSNFINTFSGDVSIGESFNLTVNAKNFDSGESDIYLLRIWVDWNGNFLFDENESVVIKEFVVGAKGKESSFVFPVNVPSNAILDKLVGMRILLHFKQGSEGENPCGTIDSGEGEDYGLIISKASSGAEHNTLTHFDIVPNPTTHAIAIKGIDSNRVQSLTIYNMYGIAVSKFGYGTIECSVRNLPAGVYIAVVNLGNGTFAKQRFVKI